MCCWLLKKIIKFKLIKYFWNNNIFSENSSKNFEQIKKYTNTNNSTLLQSSLMEMIQCELIINSNDRYYMDELIFRYRYIYRVQQFIGYIALIILFIMIASYRGAL